MAKKLNKKDYIGKEVEMTDGRIGKCVDVRSAVQTAISGNSKVGNAKFKSIKSVELKVKPSGGGHSFWTGPIAV